MLPRVVLSLLLHLLCFVLAGQEGVTRRISGKIIDWESKEPLIGASILIEGTTEGTVTDIDGTFELDIPAVRQVTLRVSYTCGGPQIRTKAGKSYYFIKVFDPGWKYYLNSGLGPGWKLRGGSSSYLNGEIGVQAKRSIRFAHLDFVAGLEYRHHFRDQKNNALGCIGLPFGLAYSTYQFDVQMGLGLNRLLIAESTSFHANQLFTSMHLERSHRLNHHFRIFFGTRFFQLQEAEGNAAFLSGRLGLSYEFPNHMTTW